MADYTKDPKYAPYLEVDKFYNHGDNPALKNFMKIALENTKDGKLLDHRTYVIDKGQRFFMARNWDDFLQRDLQAITFPRAFGIFLINTMFFIGTARVARSLVPIGRFGIRTVYQTPLYHNFGNIGLVGAAALLFTGVFTEYKTFKFTLHKFYRHVLMGERNWYLEEKKNTQLEGSYESNDQLLSEAAKLVGSLKRDWKPYYSGPYGINEDPNKSKTKK